MGFDELSFWEQPVMWGDQDMFQYVFLCILRLQHLTVFAYADTSTMFDMVRIRYVDIAIPH